MQILPKSQTLCYKWAMFYVRKMSRSLISYTLRYFKLYFPKISPFPLYCRLSFLLYVLGNNRHKKWSLFSLWYVYDRWCQCYVEVELVLPLTCWPDVYSLIWVYGNRHLIGKIFITQSSKYIQPINDAIA